MSPRAVTATMSALLFTLCATAARADDLAPPLPDRPKVLAPLGEQPAPHGWLYLDDPTTPGPLTVVAHTQATYTSASADRAFAFDTGRPGAVLEAGADVGLLSWLSLTASGYGGGERGRAGAVAGVRVSLLPRSATTHLVLAGGAMREMSAAVGVWGSATFEQDLGRARLASTVRAVHSFAAGRDAADVMVTAGASYRLAGPLRGGVEWVAQELEGLLDDEEAEGGVRHFLGPSASVELLDRRLSVVVGPAFGLSSGAPPLIGRMSVAYLF